MRAYLKRTGKTLNPEGSLVKTLSKGKHKIVVRNTDLRIGYRTKWDGGQAEIEVNVTRKGQWVYVSVHDYPNIVHDGLTWHAINLHYWTMFLENRLEVTERNGLGFNVSFLGYRNWIEFPEKPLVRPILAEAVRWASTIVRDLGDKLAEWEESRVRPKGPRSRFDIMEDLHVPE